MCKDPSLAQTTDASMPTLRGNDTPVASTALSGNGPLTNHVNKRLTVKLPYLILHLCFFSIHHHHHHSLEMLPNTITSRARRANVVIINNATERRTEQLRLSQGSQNTLASSLTNPTLTGELPQPTPEVFTLAPQGEPFDLSSIRLRRWPFKPRVGGILKQRAIRRVWNRILLPSIAPPSPSPLRQSFTLDSSQSTSLPRITITTSKTSSISSLPPSSAPMERRYGTLPVGTNVQNSVSDFFQPQTSFGSAHSADSNDSFQTQVPLPFHLPHGYTYNNDYAVGVSGFASYSTQARSTGSNGSNLNPASSPYIPQGNTPILPSTSMSAQGWGTPYMVGQNDQIASQGQQVGVMQYQNGIQYPHQQQQPQMQVGGPVGGMNHEGQRPVL